MRPLRLASCALVVVVVGALTPGAAAKFRVSLAFEPRQPVVRQPVLMTMRTEIVLAQRQRITVVAVGPWRDESGQGLVEARLVRVAPRVFRVRLRFPNAGRLRLQVVNGPGSDALPPIGAEVRVRPRVGRARNRADAGTNSGSRRSRSPTAVGP